MGSQRTSSTLVSDLITKVRYLIHEVLTTAGEDSDAFWKDDEDIIPAIHDGVQDIATRTGCLEETEEIDLASNTVEYSITSTTYIAVNAVVYTDANGKKAGLKRGTPTHIGHEGQEDKPEYWYEFDGKVGVYPMLSARTTEDIKLYMLSLPAAITATTDTIPTPAHYDVALKYYVAAMMFLKDRQISRYDGLMSLYYKILDRYRADFNEQVKESEDVVK